MNTSPAPTALTSSNSAAEQLEVLVKKHQSGAAWFFWIAGLSLVNSVAHLSGSEWSFILGLGITQVIDGIANVIKQEAADSHGLISAISFVLDLLVAGSFVLWGVLARKGMRWAYIVGMVLFALDGVIFMISSDIIGIAFHALALVWIFAGFKACGQLQQIRALVDSLPKEEEADPATLPQESV